MFRAKVALAVVALGMIVVPVAQAVPINYGNFNGVSVVYQQVTEDSTTDPTPLYGAPSVSGDSLNFSPVSFGASATGAGGIDLTDGTLATSLVSIAGYYIEKIQFSERGDYTLFGNGTTNTNATVTNSMFIRITNVTGGAIAPIAATVNMTFSPSDGTYDLVNDPGIGVIWQGNTLVDIDAILAAAGYSDRKATKVDITMDNTLAVLSEAGTTAYIKKKQAEGITITAIVPEPATIGLLVLGGLWLRRRS